MDSDDTIIYLIKLSTEYLDEINECEPNEFTRGEKTAYVEILEVLQGWKGAKAHGLDYNIEDKYKIWNYYKPT